MKKILPILLLWSCQHSEPAEQILSNHTDAVGKTSHINTITAFANCQGPEGSYTTLTESSFRDDYLLFKQQYDYKPNPFYAAIYSKQKGYGLDTSMQSAGPLSEPIIAVLKAHEFHELMMQVGQRYSRAQQIHDTVFFEQPCYQLRASDHLGLPVRLYFAKDSDLLIGLSQANPYAKGEVISVHFEDWERQEGIKYFKKLQIHQGKRDRFRFEYEYVSWNDPDFKKLEIE